MKSGYRPINFQYHIGFKYFKLLKLYFIIILNMLGYNLTTELSLAHCSTW